MYHFPIRVGDRVALAPHLDLWMAGVRFGTVVEEYRGETTTRYLVDHGEGVADRAAWIDADDLLGAVRI